MDIKDGLNINKLPKPWTKKQYQFALHYLADQNAAEAARKAGYSEKSAKQIGEQNLTKVHISAFISERMKKIVDALEVTPERIMREVAALAFSNIMDFITIGKDGVAFVDLSRMTREQAAAISSLETIEMPPFKTVENGNEVVREVLKNKIKFWDKGSALDALRERHNLLKPLEVNVTHAGTVAYEIPDLARRMAFTLAKAAKMKDHKPKGTSNGPDSKTSDQP